jgi:ethanolamine ammonia-lyase small subunit
VNDAQHAAADPWAHLRRHTAARVALGRAGGSLPTREVLAFAAAHAAARDAVNQAVNFDLVEEELRDIGVNCARLDSAAGDRRTYLQRPDLGRQLDASSRRALAAHAQRIRPAPDVAIVVADGLSAPACERQAAAVLEHLLPLLRRSRVTASPAFLVRHGRVAVADEIGQALGAKVSLILLGERPGLGSADSLGAYLTFDPRPGRSDAERNCVSNIRPGGLSFTSAAETLHHLLTESLRRQLSGVRLKDDRQALPATSDNRELPRPK